jgi:hypothetical protein
MRATLHKVPDPTPEEKRERLFTPPEIRENPWHYGVWDGQLTVAFGYAESGWILMAILTTTFNRSAIIHCSDTYDPFPEMQKWLEKIARKEWPADWEIDEEGYITLLRAKPEKEDNLDFQVWGYPYPENPKYPPKLVLRSRVERRQLLTEFYRRFTQYVREDFNPRRWNLESEEYPDMLNQRPNLRQVDLSKVKDELDKLTDHQSNLTWRVLRKAAHPSDFGHGICLLDTQRPRDEQVIAFIEGYSIPATVSILEPDATTSKEVLIRVKDLIPDVLGKKVSWLGMLTDRIEIWVNA